MSADKAPKKQISLPLRLTTDAMLTALGLGIWFLEAQLPPLVPIPGVKLGLSNIVILFALFRLGPADAAAVLLTRVLLASLFGGQAVSLLFSLCGGLLAFLVMWPVRRIVTNRQIWVAGILGALAHNTGQILAARFLIGQDAIFAYVPILIISTILTGLFTGICAQGAIRRLPFPPRLT